MSTSEVQETSPIGEDPPPTPTTDKEAENIPSSPCEPTPISENLKEILDTKPVDNVKQTDLIEQKADIPENKESEPINKENISKANEVQKVLENIVKTVEEETKKDVPKESVEHTENKLPTGTEAQNPGQEPLNASVPNDENKKAVDKSEEKSETNPEPEKPLANGDAPLEVNSEVTNHELDNEEPETNDNIDIQELTQHVMNILNDDAVEDVMTEKQLLKKNIDLQQFIVKLIHLLKEKTDLCANLDRQNSALISQAKSLKDVIAITKDLLGIRNMEIEHLHADLAAMEESIKEERNRHNLAVQRLGEAMGLNDKLKTEYLTQMDLFQKLRDKYNEKVVYLTRENQRLNSLVNPNGQTADVISDETNTSDLESSQTECVDK